MSRRITPDAVAHILAQALAQGLLDSRDTAVICMDLDMISERVGELQQLFPASTLHTIAVKANPLHAVLSPVVALGAGLEAASINEAHMALRAGCPNDRIVFDSPVKTIAELEFALSIGILINADNFQELDRIAFILADSMPASCVGLRVNPQVGQGRIPCTSVASDISKFGVPLDQRELIIDRFKAHAWLTGLHCHVGSQGCSLVQLVTAAQRLLDLARDVNNACGRKQVRVLDMGGGLPAPYHAGESTTLPDMAAYVAALRNDVPGLLDGEFRLITEFGRHVLANSAFAASRVEYVKDQAGQRTALIHLGADMFLRKCYQPGHWHHDLSVLDPLGHVKAGPAVPQHVAGPLCFAGDYLAADAKLPLMEPGDWVAIHDAGAYTLSMWSRYNSRSMPKVLGAVRQGGKLGIRVLKERESLDQVGAFWA